MTIPGRITGRFGQQEANDLALVLRAGALPGSIRYLEERTVGPSLGADSIRHGLQASVVSLLVVLIFMVVYYRLSGVNAVVALLLNLVILLAALAYFGAVLTLPGIAGVILTIGMGVDSNVLIFERIREELRAGKVAGERRGSGLQARVSDDYRYPRDHGGVGDLSVRLWHGPGARLCGDPDHRSGGQPVYGCLCFARDFRVAPGQDDSPGGPEHLRPNRLKPPGTNPGEAVSNTNMEGLGPAWSCFITTLISIGWARRSTSSPCH